MASDSKPRNIRVLAFSVLAGAAIFITDVLLFQVFAVGMAYVTWLLISLWLPDRRATVVMAWAATVLMVTGFFLTRADGMSALVAAADRGVATLAVWIAAALIVRRNRTEAHLDRTEMRRRTSLRALGVEPDALDDLASGHLISEQEEGRKRLSRELHDFALRLALAATEVQALRVDPSNATERALCVEGQLAELENDFRRLSRSLYPLGLDRLDLAEAIESECRSFEERCGVWINFESRNVPRTLPKEAAVCLYRVCQESLNNVAKHSTADEAKVLLEAAKDGLTLVVSDSGVGFDPETATGNTGLLRMRERVRLAKGRFEIRSQRGSGTEIVAFVPVAWADEGLAQAASA
jgi:signal transduction histidine kinase